MNKTTGTSSAHIDESDRSCHECWDIQAIGENEDGGDPGLCRPCKLAHEALDAFWQVVVRHFPEAKSGDLSPERTIRLHIAASTAVREWICNNAKPQET
jgi:hypothetical protein